MSGYNSIYNFLPRERNLIMIVTNTTVFVSFFMPRRNHKFIYRKLISNSMFSSETDGRILKGNGKFSFFGCCWMVTKDKDVTLFGWWCSWCWLQINISDVCKINLAFDGKIQPLYAIKECIENKQRMLCVVFIHS